MTTETSPFSPLNVSAMRAMRLKQLAAQRESRGRKPPRTMVIHHETVVHQNGKRVEIMREIKIERGVYTAELMRAITRQNGVGKGLLRLAVKQADRLIGTPSWMRPAPALPTAEAA